MEEKKYWFKRRRYGYGWTPVTWEGWLVIGVFLALVIGGLGIYNVEGYDEMVLTFIYLGWVFILFIGLMIINHFKGPKPKWRWGKEEGDDPVEDF